MLHSVGWLSTDISGIRVSPNFMGQVSKDSHVHIRAVKLHNKMARTYMRIRLHRFKNNVTSRYEYSHLQKVKKSLYIALAAGGNATNINRISSNYEFIEFPLVKTETLASRSSLMIYN